MTTNREAIYKALFALVTPLGARQGGTFKTVTREVEEVTRVDPGAQPVLMQDEVTEATNDEGENLPPRIWTVVFHIGVTSTKGTAGQSLLNPLIDAVEAALAPGVGDEKQTLGGLVEHVQIKGTAVKIHGNNSTRPDARQAICYFPVEIVLASF